MGQVVNIFFINISIIYLVLSLTLYLMRHVLPVQVASPLAVRVWFGLAMGVAAVLLTGLPNRYMTLERLNDVEASGLPWALLVIDVDRFK
ncbi:hypothetical protein [Exiguobacterium alkaliphilum]|uniref:hypothetical protein n=1 Tax=Exiguobacterium alkaliphilum TaxID=1428684 RepID=UPI001FE2C88D|nr:hypothetical protein [Exiguobacterium alkaliphilum]